LENFQDAVLLTFKIDKSMMSYTPRKSYPVKTQKIGDCFKMAGYAATVEQYPRKKHLKVMPEPKAKTKRTFMYNVYNIHYTRERRCSISLTSLFALFFKYLVFAFPIKQDENE